MNDKKAVNYAVNREEEPPHISCHDTNSNEIASPYSPTIVSDFRLHQGETPNNNNYNNNNIFIQVCVLVRMHACEYVSMFE